MATFSLAQLKERHPKAKAKRVFALDDIESQTRIRKATEGNQFERKPSETFLGKARDFAVNVIGGGKLAEGVGQALAAPEVQSTYSRLQQRNFESQQELQQRIKDLQSKGENTSRLEQVLRLFKEGEAELKDAQKDFGESLVSGKEVTGSALRLGTTLAGGFLTKTAARGFALGKATGFVSGATRGAGVGATSGAVFGGLQGAGVGLEQEKDIGGIAKSAGIGAASGAAIGGVLGAITGGISGSLRARQMKKQDFVKEFVAPKQTTKEKIAALKQG